MNEQFNSKFNALFSARTLDLIAKYLGRVLQLFAVFCRLYAAGNDDESHVFPPPRA